MLMHPFSISVVRKLDGIKSLREITDRQLKIGKRILQSCLNVGSGTSVCILADSHKLLEAAIFYEAARRMSNRVKFVEITPMAENAQEPPLEVADLMKSAEVCVLVTELSLSHTQARLAANKAGARIASLPGITMDLVDRTMDVNYQEMEDLTIKLADKLTTGKNVLVVSPGGTKLKFSIKGRKGHADTGILHRQGDVGNLPAGEAFIAVVEESANGTIVFDGAFDGINLTGPILVVIKNGKAVKIKGPEAHILKNRMKKAENLSRLIGEFGIGTNILARLSPNVLESEKVYGTCHFAFGDNSTFGGKIRVPFHSDGVIVSPTVFVDKSMIIEKGGLIL